MHCWRMWFILSCSCTVAHCLGFKLVPKVLNMMGSCRLVQQALECIARALT